MVPLISCDSFFLLKLLLLLATLTMTFSSLSSPEYLDNFRNAFQTGMDNAVYLYAANPRVSVGLAAGFLFIIYYLREVVKKPDLYCREGKFRWFLLANCSVIHERYWPTFWCFGTHGQTAIANCIRGALPNLQYNREYIKLPDGGQVSVDWYDAPRSSLEKQDEDQRPIAIFMPGLTGDSQTEYIKSLIPSAHSIGYRACAFNNRGRGGMKLTTARLYCAANCDDVEIVFEHLRDKYPKSKIVATGVSLGGIILCRYLTKSGASALVDAAMLISVAWDFIAGGESMEKPGLNMALNQHLTRSLVTLVKEHKENLEEGAIKNGVNFEDVYKSRMIRDFDDRFTVKMWGYSSSVEYYAASSNKGKLNLIKKPTLCVNAADDMFAPIDTLPTKEVEESSHVAMILTQRGGHIGFMEGFLPYLPFYSERVSTQYLSALVNLENIHKELL